jgi:hypothetical protein
MRDVRVAVKSRNKAVCYIAQPLSVLNAVLAAVNSESSVSNFVHRLFSSVTVNNLFHRPFFHWRLLSTVEGEC